MKISVLTASYNYENYISQTIESVLNQTYKDFEYIIFDDGSTDKSLEIIKKYAAKDSRIKVLTHENNSNQGLIKTLEKGINECSGDYIIFVESDDVIYPDYIEQKIIALQQHPDAAIVFNDINLIGCEERVNDLKKYLKLQKELINQEKFDYYKLLGLNIIPTFSCVMVKKDIIQSIPFNFNVPKCFDWYLWNLIIKDNKILYIDKILTDFRLHYSSYSCQKTKDKIYSELLKSCKKKYENKQCYYDLYTFFTRRNKLEKIFRPLFRKINHYFYNKLYIQREVSIIKLNNSVCGCAVEK